MQTEADMTDPPVVVEASGPSPAGLGMAPAVPSTVQGSRSRVPSFAMPKPVSIVGRSSSITNSFVNGVIPVVVPTEEELREALRILGMSDSVVCAYCGDNSTEWDHLRPRVENQRPTGYISEIHNLVPACGKCNQSKGNKQWESWMRSDARLAPKTRGVLDIEERISRLRAYEAWGAPTCVDFLAVVGPELWERHWAYHARILDLMREADRAAREVRTKVWAHHAAATGSGHTQPPVSESDAR